MKNNRILYVSVFLALVAFAVAVLFRIYSISDVWIQMFAAMIGAIITMIITFLLLRGQTSSEEEKDRNSKVFEERLRIYQEFLHKLCDVVKDLKIEPEDEVELEFQVAYIAMHTSPQSISDISAQVKDIIVAIKKGDSNSNEMLKQLFAIADTFSKELYGKEKDVSDDKKDSENYKNNAIENFKSIIVAQKNVTLYERAIRLQEKIEANGSKQWIWKETTLVHEFYTDIDKKTGKYIDGKNTIAVDMLPVNNEYEVTVFTRKDDEQQIKKIAEDIWGTFNALNKRHLYAKIPYTKSDEEIVDVMSKLLSDIRKYRDNKFPTK